MRVKVLTTIAAIAMLCSTPAVGRERHGLRLQIAGCQDGVTPGASVWKNGATILILITMINNTKRTINYSSTNPISDWEIDLRDGSGNLVPENDSLRKFKENSDKDFPVVNRNSFGFLKPGQTGSDRIEVNVYYDLSRPGKYFMQLQREFRDVGPVKSNRLELTITP